MFQQHFNPADYFASRTLRNRASKSSMGRLPGKFFRNTLHGQKQHGKFRPLAGYLARRLQAVHLGHGEVEHDDVGSELSRLADGVLAVERVATHRPVGMALNQTSQQAADGGVVIGNQNAYCHGPGEHLPLHYVHYYAASNCLTFNTVNTRLPARLPRQVAEIDCRKGPEFGSPSTVASGHVDNKHRFFDATHLNFQWAKSPSNIDSEQQHFYHRKNLMNLSRQMRRQCCSCCCMCLNTGAGELLT
jgi:hypothetical protein